jgi:hypothetical protein
MSVINIEWLTRLDVAIIPRTIFHQREIIKSNGDIENVSYMKTRRRSSTELNLKEIGN